NQPASVVHRWERPGDESSLPGVSTNPSSPIGSSISTFLGSNGMLVNTSFVRMKKLSLSYLLPLGFIRTGGASIFVNGQNLFTFTGYKGIVETENLRILPPLRIIEMGLHMNI
ncbi:MAG TPA: hypothetical protein VN824_06870, partial [Puia sp.]|nr:hypothetical protein [Puia sp.]